MLSERRPRGGQAGREGGGGTVGGGKGEIQEVRLRGAVDFHRTPPTASPAGRRHRRCGRPGQPGGWQVEIQGLQRRSLDAKPRRGDIGHFAAPFAKVDTDEFSIEGPVIGLDKKADQAWVDGRGTLTQMAERCLLTDKGLTPDATAPEKGKAKGEAGAGEAEKVPIKIHLEEGHEVLRPGHRPEGESPRPRRLLRRRPRRAWERRPAVCEDMTTYMGRGPSRSPAPAATRRRPRNILPARARAQAPDRRHDCVGKVIAISRKVDKKA